MIKPQVCSRCGSENIWRGFSRKEGDDKYAMMVTCKSCGYTWLEHYETTLVSIELVHFNRKEADKNVQ